MGKIAFVDGHTIGVNALRRLYYWKGALDVTQLAKSDLSILNNLVEFHPMTTEAVNSLNSVPAWKN